MRRRQIASLVIAFTLFAALAHAQQWEMATGFEQGVPFAEIQGTKDGVALVIRCTEPVNIRVIFQEEDHTDRNRAFAMLGGALQGFGQWGAGGINAGMENAMTRFSIHQTERNTAEAVNQLPSGYTEDLFKKGEVQVEMNGIMKDFSFDNHHVLLEASPEDHDALLMQLMNRNSVKMLFRSWKENFIDVQFNLQNFISMAFKAQCPALMKHRNQQ